MKQLISKLIGRIKNSTKSYEYELTDEELAIIYEEENQRLAIMEEAYQREIENDNSLELYSDMDDQWAIWNS